MKAREELLREIGELKKRIESWEKLSLIRLEEINKLEAQLALWKGTAP